MEKSPMFGAPSLVVKTKLGTPPTLPEESSIRNAPQSVPVRLVTVSSLMTRLAALGLILLKRITKGSSFLRILASFSKKKLLPCRLMNTRLTLGSSAVDTSQVQPEEIVCPLPLMPTSSLGAAESELEIASVPPMIEAETHSHLGHIQVPPRPAGLLT